jgi:membrane-associated protease RseP (regulator of RpoE activity)
VRNVKLLNGLLWTLNGLLGGGILAFAWFFLLFPKDASSLRDYRWDDEAVRVGGQGPKDSDDGILRSLRNPLEKQIVADSKEPATNFRAQLKGTLPSEKDPKSGIAFIKSMTRNVELVAYMGEEIREGDKPYEEFRGWKLAQVGKSQATFTNGPQQQTLTLDLSTPAPGAVPGGPPIPGGAGARMTKIGQPYQSTNFKSQLLAQSDNRHVWGLDPDEIDWAIQNQDSIMDQAFTVSPSANGGIRIDSVQAGSIGSARGLVAGDIIREVNGQPLNSVADVKTLMTSQAMRAQTGMRVTVERAGKPVVIEYRPMPK